MTISAQEDTELSYIQACLERLLFPDRLIPGIPDGMDWSRLAALLEEQHLAAYFYSLRSTFGSGWPKEFCETVRKTNYMFSLYNGQREIYVTQLLSGLRASGTQVIVLKGWAYIQTIYSGELGVRFCIDIDLLVRPEDLKKATVLLAQLDYQAVDESWPGYAERYLGAQTYYSKQDANSLLVGFHWGLLNRPAYNPRQVNMAELFARARPLDVAGINILELSFEDQIVYGCAHLALHHRYTHALYSYYELAALIRQAGPNPDWDAILVRARDWRCIIPLQRVLARLEKLWPGLVPAVALQQVRLLRPVFKERFVNWWIEKTRGRPSFDHPLFWITMPGLLRRLEVILKDAFPSPAYMRKRYGPPPAGLWPVLYFQRFFQAFRLMKK